MKDRPYFPKRAVVTGGMPYGDKKDLHCGHIGGQLIHADTYARFLRDRIGKDNVIFVSGTDCYGAGPVVKHQAAAEAGFTGTIEDFVAENHGVQKSALEAYDLAFNLFGASGLDKAKDIHRKMSEDLFEIWYKHGYLRLEEVEQFYDDENEAVLNGRQVVGRCPLAKCKSTIAYADECEMGHQYSPRELIAPKIATTGKTPSFKAVKNWYFDLERFGEALKERQVLLGDEGISRKFLMTNVADFLKDPTILIKTEEFDILRTAMAAMPSHIADINEEAKSATLTFKLLKDRESACSVLREHGIRFRTGTTLVPFRLTGNVKWGIPVPEKEGIDDQTFWVWPESLWAPMSFVQTYLESIDADDSWEKWWFDPDSRVYQFIGEDNIYFY
ncbi:MAG: class I tRNA ligase family protein, partial [Defluviitaleaceae bacterium]|nr:class I tRNA ligase family protein [Defluviitaleaceae bacterium]